MASERRPAYPDRVWQRIEAHAGERFEQIRGGELTYEVTGLSMRLDRTDRALARSQFKRAFALIPVVNTAALRRLQARATSTPSSWTVA